PVKSEGRLSRLLELPREPLEIRGDRRLDLGGAGTRTHDELRREPVAHDQSMAAHARRAADVQLDRTARHVHDAHGCTVRVVSDDNACALLHARGIRGFAPVFLLARTSRTWFAWSGFGLRLRGRTRFGLRVQSSQRRTTIDALWPPKPNELET